MDHADHAPGALYPGAALVGYLAWLMGCVVRSNIDLAKRIWHPDLPIQLSWTRLDTQVRSPLEKTLYANSITLTPGTLTLQIDDGHFVVHALTENGARDILGGEMDRRVAALRKS